MFLCAVKNGIIKQEQQAADLKNKLQLVPY
jgi:hypothetical protein